jgi:hypothetical protein
VNRGVTSEVLRASGLVIFMAVPCEPCGGKRAELQQAAVTPSAVASQTSGNAFFVFLFFFFFFMPAFGAVLSHMLHTYALPPTP